MEKYKKLLNMLMDFNDSIRFTAVCDQNGNIHWHSKRTNVRNIVSLEDTKKTLKRAISAYGKSVLKLKTKSDKECT